MLEVSTEHVTAAASGLRAEFWEPRSERRPVGARRARLMLKLSIAPVLIKSRRPRATTHATAAHAQLAAPERLSVGLNAAAVSSGAVVSAPAGR